MLVRLHQYKLHMFSCCVGVYKSCTCNFDSCISLTCYMVCINLINGNNSTAVFSDFPASRGLICCWHNIKYYSMLSVAAVYGI